MIQQYLTVERLYLRKKHPELAARQRLFLLLKKIQNKGSKCPEVFGFQCYWKKKKKSFPENDQKAETVSQAVLDYGLTP